MKTLAFALLASLLSSGVVAADLVCTKQLEISVKSGNTITKLPPLKIACGANMRMDRDGITVDWSTTNGLSVSRIEKTGTTVVAAEKDIQATEALRREVRIDASLPDKFSFMLGDSSVEGVVTALAEPTRLRVYQAPPAGPDSAIPALK